MGYSHRDLRPTSSTARLATARTQTTCHHCLQPIVVGERHLHDPGLGDRREHLSCALASGLAAYPPKDRHPV